MRALRTRHESRCRAVGLAAAGLPLLLLVPVVTPARAVVPGATGRIAFTSDRTGDFEIYSMNADGSGVTRLTDAPGEDREPVWSPDGTRIAFVSYGAAVKGSSSDIMLMNADGTGLTNLTSFTGFDDEPAWSPDGTKIAWRTNRANSDAEVFVMNADGTNPVQLTHHSGVDDEPAWSPDGSRLAIRRCNPNKGADAGHCSLALVNPDGTNVTDIGEITSGGKDDPAWSPDGKLIAFRSFGVDGEPDIHVVNSADGSNKVNLTNDHDSDVDPAFSPDGTKIAYVRQPVNRPERTGNGEIWTMNADGSGQVNLTNESHFDGDPDFQRLSAAAPSTATTTAPAQDPTTTTAPPGPTPSGEAPRPAAQSPAARSGYRMLGAGGKVYAFGAARHLGDAG
ncbi:MAG: TolB family protein, partial [Acidimicrobiia bacterium]